MIANRSKNRLVLPLKAGVVVRRRKGDKPETK
jgi:hypothetical protein